MGFFKGVAKFLLFLINFLILLCGIGLIAVGAIYKANNVGLDVMSVSTFAIVIGCITTLISFFGCYGACSSNGCLLTTYAVILIVLLIIQLVLGILAFVAIKNGDGELKEEFEKYLKELYEKYTEKDSKDVVDSIQHGFECCGIDSYRDSYVTNGDGTLISSCCPKNLGQSQCTEVMAYANGCAQKLTDFFETNAKIIGGVALGFCAFELIAAIFALCVRKKRDGRYY